MTEKPYYTVAEVAEIFQVDTQTVRKWLREGVLQGEKPGGEKGHWRISHSSIYTLAEARHG
jgi:excisionase family DNA binding protein